MTASWETGVALSGRELVRIELEAGACAPAPGPCSVVVLQCGSAEWDGGAMGDDPVVPPPDATFRAGPDGCRLGAVRWDAAAPSPALRCESSGSRPVERFGSWQEQLRLRDGDRDLLAPWELYRVRMVADAHERVEIHVHRVVTNVLLVRGARGRPRGYLVRERDDAYEALPLHGGDLAVVRPGLRHHVIPLEASDPAHLTVFNDAPSAYEDPDRADFHVVDAVPRTALRVRPRPDPDPRVTVVP